MRCSQSVSRWVFPGEIPELSRQKQVVATVQRNLGAPALGVMPNLMALHDEFRGQPLAMLALHDQSVQSLPVLRSKVAGAKRTIWGHRDIPFPVAFDQRLADLPPDDVGIGHGVSANRYAIRSWPTTLLIDPDGKLVAPLNPHDRAAAVAKVREALSKVSIR